MTGRRVSTVLGCFFCAAIVSVNAQDTTPGQPPKDLNASMTVSQMASGVENRIKIDNYSVNGRTLSMADRDATVSVKRLTHNVPGKARKEYEKALNAREKGQVDKAIAHLAKAVELDPEFAEACNDLGAAYATARQLVPAQKTLEKLVAVDPRYWSAYYNLALVYLLQGRLDAAERAARQSMDLERGGPASRFLLGMTLVLNDNFSDEAVELLQRSVDDYPQAHLVLARALAGRGQKDGARQEVQTFLASGLKGNREMAQRWLEALR